MEVEHAHAILEGFKRGGLVTALPKEIIGELKYIGHTWSIQSWLPKITKAASDAIWDGNEAAAIKLLMRVKIPLRNSHDAADARYRSTATGRATNTHQKRNDIMGIGGGYHGNPASKWSTVKAVRSKAKGGYK